MKFEDEIDLKMQEIRDRVLSKHGIKYKPNCLDKRKRTGRNKDLKIDTICSTFGYSKDILRIWRSGKQGIQRQRLFFLLYSLDLDVYKDLREMIK